MRTLMNTTMKPLNQNKMKQTAVEFIEQVLQGYGLSFQGMIEQAKAMEKEQQGYIGIEISDKVLFEQATVAMEEHYGYGCETEIDAYFRGAKWMQKQFIKNTEQ